MVKILLDRGVERFQKQTTTNSDFDFIDTRISSERVLLDLTLIQHNMEDSENATKKDALIGSCKRCNEEQATLRIRSEPVCQYVSSRTSL